MTEDDKKGLNIALVAMISTFIQAFIVTYHILDGRDYTKLDITLCIVCSVIFTINIARTLP